MGDGKCGKEKIAIHEQHVGFDIEKPYGNLAVTFRGKCKGHGSVYSNFQMMLPL
jgi:hypothetical protein